MSKRARKPESTEDRSGSLNRNNVYAADDVRGWAWRIRSGPGGIKMNQKFMLIAMATSVGGRGVCEMPVRYLADHIGVGIRQAQRIILELNRLELVSFIDVPPQGRPNDIVRKFALNVAVDADTWSPKMPLMRRSMRRIPRQDFFDKLVPRLSSDPSNRYDLERLGGIDIIGVRSKQLDFVSTDVEVTNAAFRQQKLILEIASQITQSPVLRLHMIPRRGYRN